MSKPIPPHILSLAIQGNRQAFRQIVEAHQSFAYAVAFRIIGDKTEAQDITQEAFVRLWKHIATYKQEIKLSTWLYKIVTNLCLDFLKSARYQQYRLHDDLNHAGDFHSVVTPENVLHEKELRDEIERATNTLSPIQKAVFVLRDLEALAVDEVCEVLSMSPDNVKSNLYHARKKISETLRSVYQTSKPNNT
jgi:RNA polymerase sigma-70 factor, ECF subfamily